MYITNHQVDIINDFIEEYKSILLLYEFNIQYQIKLLSYIYSIIPIEQHKDLYDGTIQFAQINGLNIKKFTETMIKLVLLPIFVMKYYGNSINQYIHIFSAFINYEYKKSQKKYIYNLLNLRTNKIEIMQNINIELNKNIIHNINGELYTLISYRNITSTCTEYIAYTAMINETSYYIDTLKLNYSSSNVNANYIVSYLKQNTALKQLQISHIYENDTSQQAQNDIYMLTNMYNNLIITHYNDNEFRVIIPIHKRESIYVSQYDFLQDINTYILLII